MFYIENEGESQKEGRGKKSLSKVREKDHERQFHIQ
jgi:hypothetical protein